MRSNKQKRYDEEFKSSAVKMVIEKGRTISDVSKSLDVSEPALMRWVTVAKEPESSENSRIKELETEIKKVKRENENLKDTVDVLKKSIAIFV